MLRRTGEADREQNSRGVRRECVTGQSAERFPGAVRPLLAAAGGRHGSRGGRLHPPVTASLGSPDVLVTADLGVTGCQPRDEGGMLSAWPRPGHPPRAGATASYRRSGGRSGSSRKPGNTLERYSPSSPIVRCTSVPSSWASQRTSSGSNARTTYSSTLARSYVAQLRSEVDEPPCLGDLDDELGSIVHAPALIPRPATALA